MLAALVAPPAARAAEPDPFFDRLLLLGTGAPGGAYLPIGESVCQAINTQRHSQGIRCVAQPTAGSIFNINAVNNGRLQLGIAQEDLVLEHATGRRGPGFEGLRFVAALHESPISVIVRGDTKAHQIEQIKGLRMNLGNRGSGQYTVSTALIKALGLTEKDFASISHEPTSSFERIFCSGTVDVVLEIVPHPSAVFEKLLACGGRLLPLSPEVAQRLQASNTSLVPMAIPAGAYKGQADPVTSLGVRNLLVSHARVAPESIARFMRTLADWEVRLRKEQPLLTSLPAIHRQQAALVGPTPLPAHEGVDRAFSQ